MTDLQEEPQRSAQRYLDAEREALLARGYNPDEPHPPNEHDPMYRRMRPEQFISQLTGETGNANNLRIELVLQGDGAWRLRVGNELFRLLLDEHGNVVSIGVPPGSAFQVVLAARDIIVDSIDDNGEDIVRGWEANSVNVSESARSRKEYLPDTHLVKQ